jgi:hypothetical protein
VAANLWQIADELRRSVSLAWDGRQWESFPFQFTAARVPISAFGLLVFLVMGVSQANSNNLPSAWQQKTLPQLFSPGNTLPRVDRGYMFSFRRKVANGNQSNIILHSLATGEKKELTLWIEGASEIQLEDVAVGPTGETFVAGSHTRAGDAALTNFVAEIDKTGTLVKLHDLGSYHPKRVCVGNDGSFWSMGLSNGGETEDGFGERLLRQYSPDGRLINAFLPSKKFPVLSRVDYKRSAVNLSCGDESVGLYVARPARWVEVDLKTSVVHKWRVQPAPDGRVTGLVLRGAHEVYATFVTRTMGSNGEPMVSSTAYKLEVPQDHARASSPNNAPAVDRLQSDTRPKATWQPLTASSGGRTSTNRFLVGRDDQSLIYLGGRVQGAAPTLYWVRP